MTMNCRECEHLPPRDLLTPFTYIPSVCKRYLDDGQGKCMNEKNDNKTRVGLRTVMKPSKEPGKVGYTLEAESTYKEAPDPDEGLKYDEGKPRVGEMIQDFMFPLTEVCKVWTFGANKYAKSNWKKVKDGKDRYTNAMIRHLLAEETEVHDKEMQVHHCLSVAWNALARVYFILGESNNDEEKL